MKRFLFAALTVVVAACGEKTAPVPPPPAVVANVVVDAGAPRRELARLEAVTGKVTLERDGQRLPAAAGPLFSKDVVETGPDSEAHVNFGDRIVELGPEGRVVIGEDETGSVIDVQRGFVLTRVPGNGAAHVDDGGGSQQTERLGLTILTPFGITRVAGSSEVKVDVAKDTAKLDVLVGQVELIARNGQRTEAAQGDSLSVSSGDVQFLARGKRDLTLEPMEFVLASVTGKAELKGKDQKSFKPAPRKITRLNAGDTVRTGKDGKVELSSGEVRMSLAGNGEFVFEGSGRGLGIIETNGQLKKGAVVLKLSATKRSRVNLGGVTVESDAGGQFNVAKTGEGYDVTSLAGDATVSREGTEDVKVVAGQRVRLGAKGANVDEQDRADFVLPSRAGLRVFHPGLGIAALSWEGGKGDYVVSVASDSAFTQPVLEGVVHDDWVNVPVPTRGALFWKVTTRDGKDVDHGSASFSPDTAQRDLARLRNEVPEGTETTTIYFQDKPPAVTFTFAARESAVQYKVTVYRAADLARPAAERLVSSTSAPFEAGALNEGSYRWAVTPLTKDGKEGAGGRMNKLDIVYDNSVPQLVVKAPRNGEKASGKSVAVAGVAPVGAKVYINGKPAPLDDKNRFEGSATPIGRTPIVVFRTTRASEPDVFTVRTLRRGR